MKTRPDVKTIQTIKHAAQKLTGSTRREFQATVTLDHCHRSPRFARKLFGWNPDTMRWDGIAPNVYFLDKKYHRGVALTTKEMKTYAMRLTRTPLIERWSLVIQQTKTT